MEEEEDGATKSLSQQENKFSLKLQRVTPENLKTVRTLVTSIFPVSYSDKFYQECVDNELVGVIIHNGEAIAIVAVKPENFETGQVLYIRSFGVHPRHRESGIGSFLMDFVHDKCKSLNLQNAMLHVQISNKKAIGFYKKRGFNIESMVPKYYQRYLASAYFSFEEWKPDGPDVDVGIAPPEVVRPLRSMGGGGGPPPDSTANDSPRSMAEAAAIRTGDGPYDDLMTGAAPTAPPPVYANQELNMCLICCGSAAAPIPLFSLKLFLPGPSLLNGSVSGSSDSSCLLVESEIIESRSFGLIGAGTADEDEDCLECEESGPLDEVARVCGDWRRESGAVWDDIRDEGDGDDASTVIRDRSLEICPG
ncbi:hypothetical protein GCK72_010593 [Caenorhabditis remanei]|uniref:N-terminal methionine N(alpha)-acetyltransferase NatE n=1 Tax=Caenorhabditis remanei TaxID=31234 RepID=A0A6A5H5V9_CAERE|nr:hypothetical protein GCK72_010593 [Caenorhabditis remanei]KAF1762331.1 hypothetical protein GCK72_010593 [Caenorhabditis remanei]